MFWKRLLIGLAVFLWSHFAAFAQNLIINGNAERPLNDGWVIVNGNWSQQKELEDGFPEAQDSNYIFFSGFNNGLFGVPLELYQVVDLSSFRSGIEAGLQTFAFKGYMQSFIQNPPDTAQIILEYLDANQQVLQIIPSAKKTVIFDWYEYALTLSPLPATVAL